MWYKNRNKQSGTDMGVELDKPQRPPSWRTALCPVGGQTDVPQHQTPTLTASTLPHRNPHQQQAARGQLTTHLLTAHTASALLKLHFSKQDAAAWEGENSRLGLPSELFS